ncbi:MAG: hypothetical protein Q9170_004734 [Blastenia crenularia]
MPSAVLPTLSTDEIDDLLYLARTNDLHDLKAGIQAIAQAQNTTLENIILASVDSDTGNGLLHMAAANRCMDILQYLLPALPCPSPSALNLNLTNASGNTPLHWAALNGQLDAVKLLINAGADPARRNNAGHDAMYEAERSEKEEVTGWLLREGKGLETSVGGESGEREEEEGCMGEDKEDEDEHGRKEEAVEDIQNGVRDIGMREQGG